MIKPNHLGRACHAVGSVLGVVGEQDECDSLPQLRVGVGVYLRISFRGRSQRT